MRRVFGLFFLLIAALSLTAQTDTRVAQAIKGKVINAVNNEAVSYTNIGIEDTFYGTASDEEGNFQLKIPEEMVSRQIFFSAIGYENVRFPVASLFEREFIIIRMEPQSYDIEDVDISAESRVLVRILRMASEQTRYNFLGGPFNLTGHLENRRTFDDTLVVTQDAEVLIYDATGYRQPSKSDAFRMRKYELKKAEPDYSFSAGIINFDELLELDWVRSSSSVLNPALTRQFELELADEVELDGKAAWVISFRQPEPTPEGSGDFHAVAFEGRVTILKEDYSVKMIEGSGRSVRHNRQGKSLPVVVPGSNHPEDVSYRFSVTYSRLKPEVLMMEKQYRLGDQKVEETSMLTISRVQMEGVKEIHARSYFARQLTE